MENDLLLIDNFLTTRSETAFSQLYQHKTPALYQMAVRLTAQNNEAEELVQKTWVIAIEKLQSFKGNSTLKTWLTGILINLYREHIRLEQRLKKTDNLSVLDKVTVEMSVSDSIDLENAIQQLSPGYKEILLLHDVAGFTHKEIGTMLDVSDGTSKSQLFQARKIMRKYLKENHKNQ
jgi:RNA polymerase sigma-70 factor (ECF subfamily)